MEERNIERKKVFMMKERCIQKKDRDADQWIENEQTNIEGQRDMQIKKEQLKGSKRLGKEK